MADQPASTFVVLTFEGLSAAETLYKEIQKMEKDGLLMLDDAIIIEREATGDLHALPGDSQNEAMLIAPTGEAVEHQIHIKQTHGKKGKYAAIGGGVGLLAGVLLGGPVGLLAVGTASLGAIMAAMRDFGIDDAAIDAVKQRMQPGSSALLLLGRANDRDALLTKLRMYDAHVVMSSMSPEEEQALIAQLETKS